MSQASLEERPLVNALPVPEINALLPTSAAFAVLFATQHYDSVACGESARFNFRNVGLRCGGGDSRVASFFSATRGLVLQTIPRRA